jgi:flavin-dependent dehydrogenase
MTDYDLIVVGGGPAGSTAAAIAARAGLSVLLLESGQHPRVHVGESLLPGIIPILEQTGALAEIESSEFVKKTGSTHWGWGLTPEWDLWFSDSELYDHAWFVDRARFDAMLFRAAARAGAEALEQAVVKGLVWEGERLTGVDFRIRGETGLRAARARFTIDASGQAFLVARELGTLSVIEGLQHQAAWAHFEGAGRLPPPRERQAFFVAEDRHWLWLFPLTAERTSVGVIRLDTNERVTDSEAAFMQAIAESPAIADVLGPAARRVTPVHTQRDWSYRVERVHGAGWMAVGDAAGFIDPVLSSGVFLAMHSAARAAQAAIDVVSNGASESDALKAYGTHHADLFSNLLRIVRFFYQRNLHRDDYFWESKRILLTKGTELKPQRAFLALTSGLVQNLVFEEKRAQVTARREQRTTGDSTSDLGERDPDVLGFVCIHLRHRAPTGDAALYFLIEPADPAAPTLFRTLNWHLNCLAPRFGNDPISVPEIAPHLRALEQTIRALDTEPGEPLAAFWRRNRRRVAGELSSLPESFELVRVFGE